MAKRKTTLEARSTPKATEPEVDDSGSTVISIKMTKRFRNWLAAVSDHDRSTIVQVLEKGAIAYAKQIGVKEPAPKRTEGR